MKPARMYKNILWIIPFLFSFPTICLAQDSSSQDWSLSAHFKVLKIKEIPTKYRSVDCNAEKENKRCYLISVELMDTDYYQQLADIYGDKKTYKGTRFSIVSIDSLSACDKKIRKGDVIFLTLELWSHIWMVGCPLPRHSLWPLTICGYNIPNDLLHSQPMRAKELDGLCHVFREMKSSQTAWYLEKRSIGYWDLNYKFPTSHIQARDTQAWYFPQCKAIDDLLLRYSSEIIYTDMDTALLITYQSDTLAWIDLPCSCDYTDEIPYGPRAYDSCNILIQNGYVKSSEDGYLDHLTYTIVNDLYPTIDRKMRRIGYTRIQDNEKKYPPYLLIEYLPESDSIQLIKACAKYLCYFYDDYAYILRSVLSEYCKNNNVSKLLMPVEIYIPQNNNPTDCKKSESGENN